MDESYFEDFPTPSKEDWLEKVKRDLKGKGEEELSDTIAKDWKLTPFHHASDLPDHPFPVFSRPEPLRIVQSFKKGQITSEELILNALNQGVNSPFFLNSSPLVSWITGMNQINWEMLSPLFNELSLDDLPVIRKHLSRSPAVFTFQNDLPLDQLLAVSNIHFCPAPIEASTEADLPAKLASWLHSIVRSIDSIGENNLEKALTRQWAMKTLTHSYFFELAGLRAMRLLYRQLAVDYGLSHDAVRLEIFARIDREVSYLDDENSLIAQSTAALAAYNGGADMVEIRPSESKGTLSTTARQRLARNIQHILNHESHIANISDPAAGSYALEHLTKTIAERTWDLFLKKS